MRALLTLALGLSLVACKSEGDLGKDVGAIASDTEVLRGANAAANQAIRSVGDCDALKAGLDGARQSLSEAAGRVQTATGRATLDALHKRLEDAAQSCP